MTANNDFNALREIAPSSDFGEAFHDMGFVVSENIGDVSVLSLDGTHLGSKHLGGDVEAQITVEKVGISRRSGGDVYKPISLVTDSVEHWFISDLPPDVVVDITSGQQG